MDVVRLRLRGWRLPERLRLGTALWDFNPPAHHLVTTHVVISRAPAEGMETQNHGNFIGRSQGLPLRSGQTREG